MMLLRVIDTLFLGDKNTVKNSSELLSHEVRLVVSVAGGALQLPAGVEQVRLHVKDDNQDSLLPHLDEAVKLIDQHLSQGSTVVVHCQAGISRSPAVIMAYLIRFKGMTVEEALEVVKRVRPRANPRQKLLDDLIKYQQLCLNNRVHV